MSDKNRNMNDINDQKTAEQQAFSEEIRRRLAEPGSGKPTLDEFKVMVYKDHEKRRKKRNALVACIVAAFIVGYLTYDDLVPEVGADKNPKETIQTEDGVIIEDGGYGSSDGEENVIVVTKIENLEDIKKIYPQMPIPSYVPESYVFNKMEITSLEEGAFIAQYVYQNNNGLNNLEMEFIMLNKGELSFDINDVVREINTDNGKIYFQKAASKKATIELSSGLYVNIWADINDEEYIMILNGIKN